MADNSVDLTQFDFSEIGSSFSLLMSKILRLSAEEHIFHKNLESKYQAFDKQLSHERELVKKEVDILNEISIDKLSRYNEETIINLKDRIKREEFRWFCDKIWNDLFEVGPDTILNRIKESVLRNDCISSPVLVIGCASAFSSAYFDSFSAYENYLNFCDDITAEHPLSNLFDLSFVSMFRAQCNSSISASMIAHYLMQGLPTVIFYPEIIGQIYRLEIVYWTHLRGHANISQLAAYKCLRKVPEHNYNVTVKQLLKDSIYLFSSLIADIFQYSMNYNRTSYTLDAIPRINNPDLVYCLKKTLNAFYSIIGTDIIDD